MSITVEGAEEGASEGRVRLCEKLTVSHELSVLILRSCLTGEMPLIFVCFAYGMYEWSAESAPIILACSKAGSQQRSGLSPGLRPRNINQQAAR